jgi:hypothetical protein
VSFEAELVRPIGKGIPVNGVIEKRHTLEIVRAQLSFDLPARDFSHAWWHLSVERSQRR